MKVLRLCLLHAFLIAAGYFAGAYLLEKSSSGEDPTSADASGVFTKAGPGSGNSLFRDPRTGATFANSREQLKNLAKLAAGQQEGVHTLSGGQRVGNHQVEIERVFALATVEEMRAYFAEEDLSNLGDKILSAAYARLTALSPGEAVAIWTDRHRREGVDAGVDGLVRAWAKQDSAAAEEWVNALPESTRTWDQALIALLEGSLDSDPSLALRRFTEVKGMVESSDLTRRIAGTVAPADFPAFAERILSEKRGIWEFKNQLGTALEVWAQRDASAMLDWLKEQPDKIFEGPAAVIPRLGQTLLEHNDPATIARELGPSLDGNKAFAQIAGEAWLAWLAGGDDDEGALEWLLAHGENVKFPASWTAFSEREWTADHANRILPQLDAIPDDKIRDALARSILGRLAGSSPRAAIEWAQKLLPEDDNTDHIYTIKPSNRHARLSASSEHTDQFIHDTASALARSENPSTALDWVLENITSEALREVAVTSFMETWADARPRAAAERASGLPDALRDRAYSEIADSWALSAPEDALEFLKTSLDPDSMRSFAKSTLRTIGYHHGSQAYLDRAMHLPDTRMREEAVSALIGGWANIDLGAAAAALDTIEKGPLRDASIEQFASAAANSDHKSAVTWSLSIDNPGKRRQITTRETRNWLEADRVRATRWIETTDALPEEWKEQLLGQE